MLKTGAILRGSYRILRTLGDKGVSGYTYLAESVGRAAHYAIKELDPKPPEPEIQREICTRFGAEADYLSRLGGFNGQIPKFHDSFKAEDTDGVERDYIVQEYIEGQTLTQHMRERARAMGESQVKEILSRLLPVVSHIHQENFIHRDIKPDNIILRASDRAPVLIDYGAVKEYEITLIRKGSAQTAFVGTPGYYDEDQLNGTPTVASDLYALGAVAVYLLTNTTPQAIRKKDGKLLWGDHVLGLSEDFFYVIDKAVEPRTSYPGQRFGNAQAMLDALNQATSKEELEEELTQLATRKSQPVSAKTFVKCRECEWYINFEDRHCANCGAYNVLCFGGDEIYLFNNSPGKYVEYVRDAFPTRGDKTTAVLRISRGDYNLINNSVDAYIREHTNFLDSLPDYLTWEESGGLRSIPDRRPFGVTLGEFLESNRNRVGHIGVAVWVCAGIGLGLAASLLPLWAHENKGLRCFSPCAVIIVVGAVVWSRAFVWTMLDALTNFLLIEKGDFSEKLHYYRRQIKQNQDTLKKKLHGEATHGKKVLESRCQSYSAAYRESGFYLKRAEININKQLESISASKTRLSKVAVMLDSVIRDTPSDISTDEQKRDQVRTSSALEYLSQQHMKYKAKLQEIELLRRNNVLQADTPRHKVTQDERDGVREKIGRMAKLSDTIYTSLKRSNVADAGSERLWLERITLIREALMKLNNNVTSHVADLAYKSLDEEAADFPAEVTSGLDRLAAYLTNEDFDKEYQMLQAKYGKQ